MKNELMQTTSHQQNPHRADRTMGQRSLGRAELHHADCQRRHGGEGMNLDRRARVQQRSKNSMSNAASCIVIASRAEVARSDDKLREAIQFYAVTLDCFAFAPQ